MPAFFGRSFQPMSGSWLSRFLAPPHPDAFTAGLLEGGRWRFAPSAVDPYQPEGVVSVRHGARTLRLRVEQAAGTGARDGHVLVLGVDVDSGAPVQLSVPAGDVVRFGVSP